MAVSVVDVDDILIALGRLGKYQIKQIIVLCVTNYTFAFHVLSVVFIGYRPEYSCKSDVITDNQTIGANGGNVTTWQEYGQCSIKTYSNISGVIAVNETGCTAGWHYVDYKQESSFATEWNLVCERDSLTDLAQTLYIFGQGIGGVIFTSLSDRFGRKLIHVTCHIAVFLVTLGTAFVPSYPWFAVMRLLTGAMMEGMGLSYAVLLIELVPMELRAAVDAVGLLCWSTGIALVTPIAYAFRNNSWRHLQICLAMCCSWSLIEWWCLDESFRWLIANGKISKAKAILRRACKDNKKDYDTILTKSGLREINDGDAMKMKEILNPAKSVGKEIEDNDVTKPLSSDGTSPVSADIRTKKYTILDLFTSKRLLVVSVIMWFAWATNSLVYYGLFLMSSSLAGDRFLNFFLGSIVEYPVAPIKYIMVNRCGRKATSIMFHAISGIAFFTATVLNTFAESNASLALVATAFTLIGKFGISGSFSTIFLYTPELYPTNMRTVGYGMASAACRIGGMVAPFSRKLLDVAVWFPGLVFGGLCAIVTISLLWVPETNKHELPQKLEECEEWYKQNRFKLPGTRKREQLNGKESNT